MDKQRFLQIVNGYYNNKISGQDIYELIYEYCIDKGKDAEATKKYVQFILSISWKNVITEHINTIIRDWGVKHEITEVHQVLPDGRTKLIKIY